MSEIVKNELDAIKAFETGTEKRRSELTLNELNYISDKQLHKKDGGGGTQFEVATVRFINMQSFPYLYFVNYDAEYPPSAGQRDALPSNDETFYVLKGSSVYSTQEDISGNPYIEIEGPYEADDGSVTVLGDLVIRARDDGQ